MGKSFDFYRSTSSHLTLTTQQETNYQRYLARIDAIVDKKPTIDHSTEQNMQFRNECRVKARTHQSQEVLNRINHDNHILLERLLRAKEPVKHPKK